MGGAPHADEEDEDEAADKEAADDEAADVAAAATEAIPQRNREAEREWREQARTAQRAAAEARRAEREARQVMVAGDVEGRRTALPEEMQGHAAGLDLAPATWPRPGFLQI